MTFKSGLLPYSDAERENDARRQREARLVASIRRQATPSGQDYNRKPNRSYRRWFRRVMGEVEEDID